MKTIELQGTIESKTETYREGESEFSVSIELNEDEGSVNLYGSNHELKDLEPGAQVRLLIVPGYRLAAKDDAPKENALTQVANLVAALEAGRAAEKAFEEPEGWSDKKIERRLQPKETICSSGGIYAPGTK